MIKKQPPHPLKTLLPDFEAVLFDLDGTLVDSMWMWRQIDIEYLGRFGIPLPQGLQGDIEGMSFSETAVYFKERFKLPDSLEVIKAEWNRMACEKYRHEVSYKRGAKEFLAFCKAQNLKLGIATSNSIELVSHVADALSMTDYISCITTGCEVKKGKPAPDVYLETAKKLNVAPAKCLVFEDIIPGILAGKAAGMCVCAIEDDYSKNIRKEKEAAADYYITDYLELL